MKSKSKKRKAKPEEIIFIDDNRKYLIPAKKLGIFKNHKQLTKDLKKSGVKI